MHQLYFVAVPKEDGDTLGEAMNKATQLLDENNFCNAEGGYFSSSKGDWYEVGGRWSDFLCNRHEWAKQAHKEIEAYLKRPENMRKPSGKGKDTKPEIYSIRGTHYGTDEERAKQAELRERCELIWGKYRPTEYPKVPYDRFFSEDGIFSRESHIDDCAEALSQELVDWLQKHEWTQKKTDGFGHLEIFVEDEDGMHEEWVLADWLEYVQTHKEEFIGKYWLVAIDYHS